MKKKLKRLTSSKHFRRLPVHVRDQLKAQIRSIIDAQPTPAQKTIEKMQG